jgi:UDP-N-acetylglucosamine--N-acetylmuramyl-(pentapeptide) pyrophosphoryl-undecaprenol N-acetylglucosamine transferase
MWGIPSIIIPIANHVGDHQRKNAFAYARAGAAVVIEEANLGPSIVFAEIDHLMNDGPKRTSMSAAAQAFSRTDAAEKIAEQIIAIVLKHKIEG